MTRSGNRSASRGGSQSSQGSASTSSQSTTAGASQRSRRPPAPSNSGGLGANQGAGVGGGAGAQLGGPAVVNPMGGGGNLPFALNLRVPAAGAAVVQQFQENGVFHAYTIGNQVIHDVAAVSSLEVGNLIALVAPDQTNHIQTLAVSEFQQFMGNGSFVHVYPYTPRPQPLNLGGLQFSQADCSLLVFPLTIQMTSQLAHQLPPGCLSSPLVHWTPVAARVVLPPVPPPPVAPAVAPPPGRMTMEAKNEDMRDLAILKMNACFRVEALDGTLAGTDRFSVTVQHAVLERIPQSFKKNPWFLDPKLLKCIFLWKYSTSSTLAQGYAKFSDLYSVPGCKKPSTTADVRTLLSQLGRLLDATFGNVPPFWSPFLSAWLDRTLVLIKEEEKSLDYCLDFFDSTFAKFSTLVNTDATWKGNPLHVQTLVNGFFALPDNAPSEAKYQEFRGTNNNERIEVLEQNLRSAQAEVATLLKRSAPQVPGGQGGGNHKKGKSTSTPSNPAATGGANKGKTPVCFQYACHAAGVSGQSACARVPCGFSHGPTFPQYSQKATLASFDKLMKAPRFANKSAVPSITAALKSWAGVAGTFGLP